MAERFHKFNKQASMRASTDDSSLELVKKRKLTNETELTDLNYDCLCNILEWLSVHDAMKMCEVSKNCVEPVNRILKVKCRQSTFTATENSLNFVRPAFYNSLIYVPPKRIRSIGQSIVKLLLDYDGNHLAALVSFPVLEGSILKHCTELTELTLVNAKSAPFESINTPVATLEVLHLNNCILGPVFCQFSKWLPKLRTLSVNNCKIVDKSCIRNMTTSISTLQSIHLDVIRQINPDEGSDKEYILCNVDGGIIKANSHVRCFGWLSDMRPRRLASISKLMKKLETLKLQIHLTHFEKSITPIHFKSVTKLVLKITGYERFQCPLVFDALQELDITTDGLIERWFFFSGSSELRKLKMIGFCPTPDDLLAISFTWSSLVEVSMQLINVSAHKITTFIRSLSNLQRFNILKFECQSPFFQSAVESQKFDQVKRDLSDKYTVLPETDEYRYSLIPLI